MDNTPTACRGMVVAPHHLAAQSGLAVLRDGGTAVEAAVAAAATAAVVYPHMCGLGGDAVWLIHEPGRPPIGIDACGAAGAGVTPDLYPEGTVPARGPGAANTVAGMVDGWRLALDWSHAGADGLPPARLLADAIHHAEAGFPVSNGQVRHTADHLAELAAVPGFADVYAPGGLAPVPATRFRQPALAATLRRLATAGFDDFYRGGLARAVAAELGRAGSPLTADDLAGHGARHVAPLSVGLRAGRVFNLPPPTQGLAALLILGIFDRLGVAEADGFAHIHGLVEATKPAFRLRDAHIGDPAHLTVDPERFLATASLDTLAAGVDRNEAAAWSHGAAPGDTVWIGAVDGAGRVVSCLHSLYWEFGSGLVLPETGIVWQNRGACFSLVPDAANALAPGRKPLHTLNPALAHLADGRVMAHGSMGGDGQPQFQAALFTRHVLFGQPLQRAVAAPRWLLGRTWGEASAALTLEDRFDPALVEALRAAGHEVRLVPPFSDLLGHAGALVLRPDGIIEGAADPRSDGMAAGY